MSRRFVCLEAFEDAMKPLLAVHDLKRLRAYCSIAIVCKPKEL